MLASAVVNEAKSRLFGNYRTELNRLATGINASATELTFDLDLRGIVPGSILSVGQERLYVWSTERSTGAVEVMREYGGTTASAHAAGAVVEVNSRFPNDMMMQTLKEEIDSWPSALFATATNVYETTDSSITLTVGDTFIRVVSVEFLRGEVWRRSRMWRTVYVDGVPTLYLDGVTLHDSIRVVTAYSYSSDSVTFDTDLTVTPGLPDSFRDLLVVGICWRLMSTREVARTFVEAQGDSRRATDVEPGQTSRAARDLAAMREMRLQEEITRLQSRFQAVTS